MNTHTADPWAWWTAALAGKAPDASTEPEWGFYRVRESGGRGQWRPVAIWQSEGKWIGLCAGQPVGDVHRLWTYCLRHPITDAAYEKAMAGEGFDDEPPLAAIGHNSADADPLEALRLEFMGEKEQAEDILKRGIKSQAEADRASIWKDRILKIRSRAEALFRAEKQPVLDEGKRIDEKYRALAHERDSDCTALVNRLRKGMEDFLKDQKRAEEERQRKAREEALRLEREAEEAARRAALAEDAALAAQADAGPPDGPTPEETAELRRQAEEIAALAQKAEREAEARKVTAGRTGATTSLRKVKVGVVTDYAKAAAALVAMQHKDLILCIDGLAQRAAKSGMPFDGMEIREEDKAI